MVESSQQSRVEPPLSVGACLTHIDTEGVLRRRTFVCFNPREAERQNLHRDCRSDGHDAPSRPGASQPGRPLAHSLSGVAGTGRLSCPSG